MEWASERGVDLAGVKVVGDRSGRVGAYTVWGAGHGSERTC